MTSTDIHAMLGYSEIIGTAIGKIRDIYCLDGLPPEHGMAKFLDEMEAHNNLLALTMQLEAVDIWCDQNDSEAGKP